MEIIYSLAPLLAVMVSLGAVVFIVASHNYPNVRESWTILAGVLKFGFVIWMVPDVLAGHYPEVTLFDISSMLGIGTELELALRADPAGMIFALSASFLWLLTSFYSIGYMRGAHEKNHTRYFASMAVCMSSAIGLAFSANLLTFFLFYELLTAATYPLVIHKETPEAKAAGRKYLVYLLTSGVVILGAMAYTYGVAGSFVFTAGGVFTADMIGRGALITVFVAFLLGFGVKGGLMPLHSWLPSAMVAPTPVSALLHAVAVVKAGVFGMVRVTGYVFGPGLLEEAGALTVMAVMASLTIVIASLMAFNQDNLKRRLAYSTIGDLSYILLGLAVFASSAWIAALLHIVNHAAMKITLFFCAGAIYVKEHLENVSELNGLGRQMPLTFAAFAVGSIGLAGVPPVAGFITKWYLVEGNLETGHVVFALAILLSGLLKAGYLFPIVFRGYFLESTTQKYDRYDEASYFMVIPLMLTALLSLGLMFPEYVVWIYDLAVTVSEVVMVGEPS